MSGAPNDHVYLQFGDEEAADGELIARANLPEGAYPTVLLVDGAHVDGHAGEMYEVWVIEPNDVDFA